LVRRQDVAILTQSFSKLAVGQPDVLSIGGFAPGFARDALMALFKCRTDLVD